MSEVHSRSKPKRHWHQARAGDALVDKCLSTGGIAEAGQRLFARLMPPFFYFKPIQAPAHKPFF